MRFRGTLILFVLCAALGAFVYYYEIKGGEKRSKAKEEESQLWKVDAEDIQQLDLVSGAEHITAVRSGDKQWKLTAPRPLEADSGELDRLAGSAASISRESVTEKDAKDLARFGLNPPQHTLSIRTKQGREYSILFGNNNPTGSSTYAALGGSHEVVLVTSYVASNFNKKLDDLRNHSILSFDQYDTSSLDIKDAKGTIRLAKDGDRWFIEGKEKWAADSSEVSTLLSALANGRVKEFFDGNPDEYQNLGFDKPTLDIRAAVGKDKAIKHLEVGLEKSQVLKKGEKPVSKPAAEPKPAPGAKPADSTTKLYIARDESRSELFWVEGEFVDKFLKSPDDLRSKTLASFQRWDVDTIELTGPKGSVTIAKADSGGDWLVGADKKKAKWDAVNGVLDSLEKPVKQFVDDNHPPAYYGLDKPAIRVILKQKGVEKVDCSFGRETQDGVYAQVKGESSIKLADKDVLKKLDLGTQDFIEPPPAPPATPASQPKK